MLNITAIGDAREDSCTRLGWAQEQKTDVSEDVETTGPMHCEGGAQQSASGHTPGRNGNMSTQHAPAEARV